MKSVFVLLVVSGCAAVGAAPDGGTKAGAAAVVPASAAVLTAPMVLKEGAIFQPERTDLPAGGKAVWTFTVAKAGTYYLHAIVDAPAEDSNSFYLSIDGPPEDPLMIWDIDVTSGFEERMVSWRGRGEPETNEFKPRRFELAAGTHQLTLTGREPKTQFKSFWLVPVAK